MRHGDQDGFSLVEVLVAFAILAVAAGALFSAFGSSARLSNASEDRTLALLHARSLLAEIEPEPVEETVARSGRFDDGFRWRATVSPFGNAVDREAWSLAPYDVEVTVAWGDPERERTLSLSTLKLRPKDP